MQLLHEGSEGPRLRVLLVEDEPRETELAAHAIEWGDGRLWVYHTDAAEEALQFLRQEPPFDDAQLPHVVITDLEMPRMSGLDLLREIKADRRITSMPVVVLSNSRAPADVEAAYTMGASLYIAKPLEVAVLADVVSVMERLFLDVVTVMDDEGTVRSPT